MSKQDMVFDIQAILFANGYNLAVDGFYGEETAHMVDLWQKNGGRPMEPEWPASSYPVDRDDCRLSNKGIAAVISHEGLVPTVYFDSVGIKTVYFGHTSGAGAPNPADMSMAMPYDRDDMERAIREALSIAATDAQKFLSRIAEAVTVPMLQHEVDAAFSFDYNTGSIDSATWVKTWNAGDKALAAEQMLWWDTPAEIIPRRQAEADLFLYGRYPAESATIWETDGHGHNLWRPIMTVSPAQMVAYLEQAGRT
jgi:lysozyme